MDALKAILSMACLFVASSSEAGALAVRFGPLGTGTGGTNPLGIPPRPTDIGVSYVSDKRLEYNLSLTGLTLARRDQSRWGGYASVGGGLIFSANGTGLGPYAAFGYESGCSPWIGCFSIEMSQALGLSSNGLLSPYALRVGVIRWF